MKNILKILVLTTFLPSCKSLADKCASAYPPELRRETIFLSSDTTIPEAKLKAAVPCPELANSLDKKGRKTILAESGDLILTARKDKNGEVVLDAVRKEKVIPKTNQKTIESASQTIHKECDCKAEKEQAKYDLLVFQGYCFLVALGLFLFIRYNKDAIWQKLKLK